LIVPESAGVLFDFLLLTAEGPWSWVFTWFHVNARQRKLRWGVEDFWHPKGNAEPMDLDLRQPNGSACPDDQAGDNPETGPA
jgi:hypothetical protein